MFLSDAPQSGGRFHFTYQNVTIEPKRGDVLVFPTCPLHPNSVTAVESDDELVFAFNYIM